MWELRRPGGSFKINSFGRSKAHTGLRGRWVEAPSVEYRAAGLEKQKPGAEHRFKNFQLPLKC